MFSSKDKNDREKEIEREERALKIEKIKGKMGKYTRMETRPPVKSIDHYGLKKSLKRISQEESRSALHAARAELIHNQELPGLIEAEGMERTYRLKQEDIVKVAPIAAGKQHYQMEMTKLGPYSIDYSRSGRYLLVGGRKGHVISMDWRKKTKRCEIQVMEATRDVQYLHSDGYFAAAQKRYVYIYDGTGTELHRVNKMESINKLSFLPHHFLLVSANEFGVLGYLDVSIGEIAVMIRTGMGPLRTMCHNPYNAVLHLGHGNGTVSLWTPNMGKPAVKMLCHRANVTGIGVDISGRYMVTSGMDAMLKVWDIRTYQPLHSLYIHKPATDISISQRGLIATGHGKHCQIWQDVFSNGSQRPPYLKYQLQGDVHSLSFCPFEDCLGIGHGAGFTSIIVPDA